MQGEELATRTRVMLVEDQPDFRRLMVALLDRQPDLEVVAQAGSLTEAREHAAVVRFDVAVLDLGLPDGNGADLISYLRVTNPDVAVLILSASLDPASLERAAQAGASEIMDKLSTPGELIGAIRRLGTAESPDTV
ncbi:MAG: domain S-box protein [Rubrobacteraceae bacterium]|jgi:two-component system response regulator DesR|nr:domain S-box protein [Rubrobacteraceae bacterium]